MARAAIKNNASTQLDGAITSTDTLIAVLDGSVLPTITATEPYFYLTLLDSAGIPEIIKVTSNSANILNVVRGQDGTTARAFADRAYASCNIIAALLNELAPKDNPTFTGNILIAGNSGSNRVIGFSGGTNTTLVLQASAASGAGANLELTNDYYAYMDANTFRSRSADGATIYTETTSSGFDVKSGSLKQAGVSIFSGVTQIAVVTSLPGTPNANTLYIVTGA